MRTVLARFISLFIEEWRIRLGKGCGRTQKHDISLSHHEETHNITVLKESHLFSKRSVGTMNRHIQLVTEVLNQKLDEMGIDEAMVT